MSPQFERGGVWHEVAVPIGLRVAIRGILLSALAYADGNQKHAAAALQISPRTMDAMMKSYDVPRARATRSIVKKKPDGRGRWPRKNGRP